MRYPFATSSSIISQRIQRLIYHRSNNPLASPCAAASSSTRESRKQQTTNNLIETCKEEETKIIARRQHHQHGQQIGMSRCGLAPLHPTRAGIDSVLERLSRHEDHRMTAIGLSELHLHPESSLNNENFVCEAPCNLATVHEVSRYFLATALCDG